MVSLSVVSEIAMVPESECRTPTLIGQSCAAAAVETRPATAAVVISRIVGIPLSFMFAAQDGLSERSVPQSFFPRAISFHGASARRQHPAPGAVSGLSGRWAKAVRNGRQAEAHSSLQLSPTERPP